MPEMAGIRSTLIKEKNMITNYEATVVTTDDIVHEVNLEGKRIGYVIKTENKETPMPHRMAALFAWAYIRAA